MGKLQEYIQYSLQDFPQCLPNLLNTKLGLKVPQYNILFLSSGNGEEVSYMQKSLEVNDVVPIHMVLEVKVSKFVLLL